MKSLAKNSLARAVAIGASSPLGYVGRRILPVAVKQRLLNFLRSTETENGPVEIQHALAELEPICIESAFAADNIVLVNNALAWGGAERQIVTLLQALEQRGQRSDLLCLRLSDTKDNDFYLPMLKGYRGFVRNACVFEKAKRVLTHFPSKQRKQIEDVFRWMPLDAQNEIVQFVAEFLVLRPRAVHAWQDSVSITAGYAARIVGVPRIVVSSRNVNPTNFAYFRPYMYYAYRELARCANIRMVNNSEAGALDYASWLGIERQRFEIHRNGIDMSVFQRAEPERVAMLRNTLGIPVSAPVVGSLFRLYTEKDPDLWVDMARRVAADRPDVHFVIFGVGPMKNSIKSKAREYGLSGRLHLPGTIDDAKVAFGLFDIFVLTSRHEGTPNAVIEASILGVPVVATAAGGTAEVILSGETGLLAERDPEKLASIVLSVLADPSWSSRARASGPAFIKERFGLDRMVGEALAYYGVVGAKPPA